MHGNSKSSTKETRDNLSTTYGINVKAALLDITASGMIKQVPQDIVHVTLWRELPSMISDSSCSIIFTILMFYIGSIQ